METLKEGSEVSGLLLILFFFGRKKKTVAKVHFFISVHPRTGTCGWEGCVQGLPKGILCWEPVNLRGFSKVLPPGLRDHCISLLHQGPSVSTVLKELLRRQKRGWGGKGG